MPSAASCAPSLPLRRRGRRFRKIQSVTPVPQRPPGGLAQHPLVEIIGEGERVGLDMIKGDVEVGRVEQPPHLAVDGPQQVVHAQAGADLAADLGQDAQFGDAPVALGEQAGVFQGAGDDMGHRAEKLHMLDGEDVGRCSCGR